MEINNDLKDEFKIFNLQELKDEFKINLNYLNYIVGFLHSQNQQDIMLKQTNKRLYFVITKRGKELIVNKMKEMNLI